MGGIIYFFDAGKTYNICEISKQLEITGIEKLDEIKDFMIKSKVMYRKRPPVFLESNGNIFPIKKDFQPINSLCQIPMYSESYCLLDKEIFFRVCKFEEEKKKIADYIKKILSEELPFAIPGPDSERIGNFEVLSHPYFDSIENDPVSIEVTDKEKLKVVEVTLDKIVFSKIIPCLIRCQLKNGNVITSNQCQIIKREDTEIKAVFSSDESCTNIEIEIWKWDEENSKTSELVYSYKTTIIREIHMNSGISTLSATINYTWIRKKHEIEANIEAKKVFSNKQVVGGHDHDPWVQASDKIRDSFKGLYPSKSKGVFFETGWVGKEGFIKWLQDIVRMESRNDLNITKVLLIDPYFDDKGVIDFLAGSVEQSLEYEVVLDLEKKPSREEKIQNTCREIKYLLPLKLNIFGLKRKKDDTDQIIHDRFVHLLHKDSVVTSYLLSNSLNGASKNHPLVVTPIPKDIQKEVLRYYDNLINEETKPGNALEKVNIWTTEEQKSVSIKKEEEVRGLKVFPYIDLLLDVIFENEKVPDDQISKDKRLLLSPDDTQRKAQLNRIGERLNQFVKDEDFKGAFRLWCGVTNWMVRLSVEEDDKSEISIHLFKQEYASAVAMICKEVIEKCHLNDFPLGYKDQNITNSYSLTLSQQIDLPIIDSLPVAFYMHNLSPFREYPYNYTISESNRILLKLNPDVSVELIEKAIAIIRDKRSEESKVTEDAIIKTYNLLLEELKQWLIHNIRNDKLIKVITAYLISGEAFIRSMAVSSIGWYLYVDRKSFNLNECKPLIEEIEKIKDRKEVVESYIWLLSKCNFKLREDNGNLSFYKALEKELIYQIVACWEKDCFNDSLRKSLVCLLIESNSKGALEQTNGLFKQLADKGKICFDEYLDIIHNLLLDKLELHSKDKYHYYDPVDKPFSEQAIQLLKTSDKHIRSIFVRICKLYNESFMTLNKFLVKSRYYSEWSRSLESLYWIGHILALIIDDFNESNFDLVLLESAKQALKEIQQKIKEKDDSFIGVNRLKTRYEEKIRSVEVKLNKDPLS